MNYVTLNIVVFYNSFILMLKFLYSPSAIRV